MDNLSRSSLPLPEGRDTMDVYLDDRQENERRILQLQSELRLCKQTISTLSCVNSGDNGQKLIDLASENSKIREELDSLLTSKEVTETQNREALQRKTDEINEVKRQLAHAEADRDRYLRRCQELEQRLAEEESRFYQQELDGRTTAGGGEPRSNQEDEVNEGQKEKETSEHSTIGELPSTLQQDRIQQKITQLAHDNSQLNSIFDRMDQSEMLASSILNQTQTAAEQLEKHAKRINVHHTGVVALYEQLKHTANFLGQIVSSVGLSSSQIDLLMQKINQLELEIQESNDMSVKIANETKQLANEMSNMSTRIEQSIRQNVTDVGLQSSFINNSRNTKAFDDLLAKNAELIKQTKTLSDNIEDLKCQLVDMETDRENYRSQMTSLSKEKREVYEKLDSAMKMLQERDDELENRQNIIQQLKELGTGNYDQTPPPPLDYLKDEIEDQLRHIYTTLYKVSHEVQKKN